MTGNPASPGPGLPGLKAALRTECRARRRLVIAEERARETAATVHTCQRLLAAVGAATIGSYLGAGSELDLAALHQAWWAQDRKLWFPRIVGPGTVAWHRFGAREAALEDAFKPGQHGLSEPDPLVVPAAFLPPDTLLLVPGLAFGADGRRLGQGGGYFDRVLAVHKGPTIGVGFSCQRRDDLPVEGHDRPLDAVVLGGEVVRAPSAWLTSP